MSWIQMRDFWTFRPTEVRENKQHLFECKDSQSDTGHSLLVHVAASHAGIVNGNRRFYRPDKMMESIHTWLPQKSEDGLTTLRTARPVLIGHNEHGDVLGRVLEAKYVDESYKYSTDMPVLKDFLFYQRDGRKRKSLFDSVDWIVDNLLPLDEYTGLGYTDLGLRITNPDAIRKVLADEYLTVSVGFKTDAAVCSLCHTDWATDGKCGHKPGEMEDGKSMFIIAGSLINQEVSFINFAADPFATTLSKKVLTDSLEKMFFLGLPINMQNTATADGLRLTDGLYESDLSVAEDSMNSVLDISTLDFAALSTELKSPDLTSERALSVKDSLAAWAPETEELKTSKRSLVSVVNAKIRKNKWDAIVQDATDPVVAAELVELMEDAKKKEKAGPSGQSKGVSTKSAKAAKEFQGKEIAMKHEEGCEGGDDCECTKADAAPAATDFADWKAANDLDRDFFADAAGVLAEVVLEMGDTQLVDNKDSYCGPLSTFPIADAASAAAARTVLGRAKISVELRDQILGNITIKEAAFPAPTKAGEDTTAVADGSNQTDEAYTKLVDAAIGSVVLKDGATAPKEIAPEVRASLVATLKSLDKGYTALPKETDGYYDATWILRQAVRSMLDHWSADDQFAWAMSRLAGNKDHVVLMRSELDEKDEVLNGLMSEKDSLVAENTALVSSRNVILAATKHTLAQQIVMHNVLKGHDGFKSLTAEQTNEKIESLSKRHITSLRDSVSDILTGLKFTDSTAATTPIETTVAVDDHTQITDATAAAATATDAVLDEATLEAQHLLQSRLRYMSPPERARFLGKMRLEAAQIK
jgi:hypothetical protein